MSNVKKLMMTAAGGDPVNVENVFSTFLYEGADAAKTIVNNIDLTEGGLVWGKSRSAAQDPRIYDTEGNSLYPNYNYAGGSSSGLFTANNNGFDLSASSGLVGGSVYGGPDYVSWTFRKAKKFFDVVTYTGNGTAGRTISHNLGSVPGMIMVKNVSATGTEWRVWHRSLTSDAYTLLLNATNGEINSGNGSWNSTAPTSSVFTVGADFDVNKNNDTHVAYVFAHNNNDGNFGPDQDKDIIKCGDFTSSGNAADITLGFEPQFLLIKQTDSSSQWFLVDAMRGLKVNGVNGTYLAAQSNAAESSDYDIFDPHPRGFNVNGINNGHHIYMAIRRGPMAIPENASDVFAVDAVNTSATPNYVSGFPVDFLIEKSTGGSNTRFYDRIRGQNQLYADNDWSEGTGRGSEEWDHMTGVKFVNSSSYYCWMWKRAPHFMDTVVYSGDGGNTSTNTKPHSLGVKPEMIIIKCRSNSANWMVWHKDMNYNSGESYTNKAYMNLNTSSPATLSSNYWSYGGNPQMTDTVFSVGSTYDEVNNTSRTYCAWLFASLAGISKVGSYTGNGGSGTTGNTQNIDCGFSNGAKFVMIKPINANDSWLIFDTERGITSGGSDPYLPLNATDQQIGGDNINPYSSGFTVVQHGNASTNLTGREYIFYAVAV